MRETVIETAVCKAATKCGWLVRKVTYQGRIGAPDRWLMKDGRLVMIEFKKFRKTPTPQQRREHKRLRDAGFLVLVIDNLERGVALMGRL